MLNWSAMLDGDGAALVESKSCDVDDGMLTASGSCVSVDVEEVAPSLAAFPASLRSLKGIPSLGADS